MTTSSPRDVELSLRVKTEGTDSVSRLNDELHQTTVAAQEQQQQANKAWREAKRATEDYYDALNLTKAKIAATVGDTEALRREQARLTVAYRDAQIVQRAKKRAMDEANGAAKAAARAEEEFKRQLQGVSDAARQTSRDVGEVGKNTQTAGDLLRTIGPALAGAFSGQQLVTLIAESESLNRSFSAVFGTAAKGGQELEFIRETANRLGLENQILARSYLSLAAATKGTSLEGQATRDVFEAVARAMGTLGKGAAETDRALTAIAQIASKGTASMEELRGQLGEALPGAMQAAAAGAGITVEQLTTMVSEGKVLAADILPALTKGLNGLYSSAAVPENFVSSWARLKNTFADTAAAIGEGGASKGLSSALSGAAIAMQGASAAADILGQGIGETVAAIVTGNYEVSAGEALANKYADALRKTAETAGFAQSAQKEQTAALQQGTQAAQDAFRASELLNRQQEQSGESALKLKAFYADLAKGSADYVTQLDRQAKARTAENEVLTRLVALYGSESEQRQVAVKVTQDQAYAARQLAQAKNTEAIIAASLAIRLKDEATKRGDNTEATRKEIEEAQKSAQAKNTESEAAKAAATSKRIEAEAASTAAQAYKDNAGRVYELRAASVAAAREVERLTELQAKGKATAEQVTEAQIRAAGATRLYRDALADATAAAERRVTAEQQQATMLQATSSLEIERARAAREVATAQGDATRASELARQETALQVQAQTQEADSARRLAVAIREAANRKEEEARASGSLTEAKKAEIAAQRASADLKDLEAQKADILAEKTRKLAESEQVRLSTLEATIALQEKALELAQRQAAIDERKRNAYDTAGNLVNAGGQTMMSIIDTLKGYGLDPKKAQEIARQFTDAQGNVPYINNPGQQRYQSDTLSMAIQKAAQQALYGGGQAVGGTATRATTVNINLGGKSTPVNVASQADADSLTGVLKQLEIARQSSA